MIMNMRQKRMQKKNRQMPFLICICLLFSNTETDFTRILYGYVQEFWLCCVYFDFISIFFFFCKRLKEKLIEMRKKNNKIHIFFSNKYGKCILSDLEFSFEYWFTGVYGQSVMNHFAHIMQFITIFFVDYI